MKKKIKNIMVMALVIILMSTPALASSMEGEEIISLGADLTLEQRNLVLDELGDDYAEVIEVTNAEEHKYLGGIIPANRIGSQALSSAKVTILREGEGINVSVSENITYITEAMYRNALLTAGITDADVEVTALSKVTGTGALTGILKAYETLTGNEIPDAIKEVANEEMVVTSEISEDLGNKEATDLINMIKVSFADKMPETEEEARTVIINIINNNNLELTDKQIDQIVKLFMRMKNSNVDWNKLANTAVEYTEKAADYLSTEEGQNFLQSLKHAIVAFIDFIGSLFR